MSRQIYSKTQTEREKKKKKSNRQNKPKGARNHSRFVFLHRILVYFLNDLIGLADFIWFGLYSFSCHRIHDTPFSFFILSLILKSTRKTEWKKKLTKNSNSIHLRIALNEQHNLLFTFFFLLSDSFTFFFFTRAFTERSERKRILKTKSYKKKNKTKWILHTFFSFFTHIKLKPCQNCVIFNAIFFPILSFASKHFICILQKLDM